MRRNELLHARVLGFALAGLLCFTTPGAGQPCRGRARVQPSAPRERTQQQATARQTEDAPDSSAASTEAPLPGEVEQLLITWEEKSSGIERLRGTFMRYVYDEDFNYEKRARGRFWYQAPDQARIDFQTVEVPDPPVNPDKIGSNGEPFRIEAEERQQWICTGREIFIIHNDLELYDYIEIPPHQQGQSPFNLPVMHPFPLAFLLGISVEEAMERYDFSLGEQNWPEGRVVDGDSGPVRLRSQVHIVIDPKTEADAREWSRAEVLLDGQSFLPRAFRMFDPSGYKETVYVFDHRQMRVNDSAIFTPNPFNDRPPRGFNRG